MKLLDFAPALALPYKAATETFAFLGRRGSGKTYAAGKLVELLHAIGVQVVILDPVGTFWGLRLAADGRSPGLPIPVFGGSHGDVPLAAGSGALIARALVEHESSAVIDVSHFRKGERKRFVQVFAEEFFHLKKDRRSPVHLVVEEAHVFVPQRPQKGEEPMLGAMEDLVRLGRNYGIGVSLLSQRAASVNKDALTQCEVLLAFQTTSKQDRDAITDWVEDAEQEVDGVLLAALNHEFFLWSPGWLKTFQQLKVKPKWTFDASSTPEVGKAIKTRNLAPIDLDQIRAAMKEAVEQAEANDVGTLRKRIRELEAAVVARPAAIAPGPTKPAPPVRGQPLLKKADVDRMERLVDKMEKHGALLDAQRDRLSQTQQAVLSESHNLRTVVKTVLADYLMSVNRTIAVSPTAMVAAAKVIKMVKPTPLAESAETDPSDTFRLPPVLQRIVDTLALLQRLGIERSRETLAAWCGVHHNTKSHGNNLSSLRSAGLLEGIELTEAGRRAAQPIEIPTQEERHERLMAPLTPVLRRIMLVALENPKGLEREGLAAALGKHPNTKSLGNDVSALRTRGLLTRGWPVKASDVFYIDRR